MVNEMLPGGGFDAENFTPSPKDTTTSGALAVFLILPIIPIIPLTGNPGWDFIIGLLNFALQTINNLLSLVLGPVYSFWNTIWVTITNGFTSFFAVIFGVMNPMVVIFLIFIVVVVFIIILRKMFRRIKR